MIFGPYGAGKSHLLAVVSLLAEFPACWSYFLAAHPEFSRLAPSSGRKPLVVQIPLDDYSGPAHSLEQIVFQHIEAELSSVWHKAWTPLADRSYFLDLFEKQVLSHRESEWSNFLKTRRPDTSWEEMKENATQQAAELAHEFLKEIGLPLDCRRSRAEAMFSLFQHLRSHDYSGTVLLIDELSTFLASKDKQSLNRDASFLQFLAQQSGTSPLWIIATAQRSLEDVGDIDSHTLRQIRDRFHGRFALSISEIRRVISDKLVEKHDAAVFPAKVAAIHRQYDQHNTRLAFSPEELSFSYPVNPLVLDCLEALAGNYLSSTRSLVAMVQEGLSKEDFLSEDAARLLTLDEIFDLEREELLALPEARRFRQVWEFLSRNLPSMVEPKDLERVQVIIKNLLLISMVGLRWPVSRFADAVIGCRERTLWGNRVEVERLLRRVWRKGAYVEVTRSAELGATEYFLDADSDVSEALRRKMNEALAALSKTDARVSEWALQTLDGETLPLSDFSAVRSVGIEWMGVRRYVNIGCRKLSEMKAEELTQAAATLESPACWEDGWLFISPPCVEPEKERHIWRQNTQQIKCRFRHGLLVWLPRPLEDNEREIMLEHAAANLLLADATLSASRKGREIRTRLKELLGEMKEECRRALYRAYLEGEVLGIDEGVAINPESLGAEKWEELLADLFASSFRKIFPDLASIAPRQRLAGRSHTNRIIDSFMRAGQAVLAPGSALEEHLRNYLEPLGFLQREGNRFQLAIAPSPFTAHLLSLLPEPAKEPQPESVISYAELEGRLRKGSFGLTPELVELVIAGLVRAGYLRGLDGFLSPLHLSQISTPMCDNLPFLMKASPLSEKEQTWLSAVGKRLFGYDADSLDLAEQEVLWDHLRGWTKRASADLPEMREHLEEFIHSLGQEKIRWSTSCALLQQITRLLEKDFSYVASAPGVSLFLEAAQQTVGGPEKTIDALEGFAGLRQFLRQYASALQQAHLYLGDSRLTLPEKSLAKQRTALLDKFTAGEEMIPHGASLVAAWKKLHHGYAVRYQAWHAHQHSLARFRAYLELKKSEGFRLGERLAHAGIDERGDFASFVSKLNSALSLHCDGSALTGVLESSPVCPECELRLGASLALPDAREMGGRLEAEVEKMQARLFDRQRIALLRKRLLAEAPGELRRRLEKLLSTSGGLTRPELTGLLSPEAAEWMRRQLSLRVAARRRSGELTELFGHREMTKGQALRLFLCWLDEQNLLQEEDLVVIE